MLWHRQLGGYKPGAGHPPLPIRLMAGQPILKHMQSLSDETLCARWVEPHADPQTSLASTMDPFRSASAPGVVEGRSAAGSQPPPSVLPRLHESIL